MNELERARDLDPFSVPINAFLGQALYYTPAGTTMRCASSDGVWKCIRTGWSSMKVSPTFTSRRKFLPKSTFAVRQQSLRLTNDIQTASTLDQAYRRSGYEGVICVEKAQILEQAPHLDMFAVLFLAHLYALLDDEADAMPCLERAYDEHNPWLLNVQVDPAMDSVRSSPRFRDLVRRIGLPVSASAKNQ